jgi:YVTN family beta-propeller protein
MRHRIVLGCLLMTFLLSHPGGAQESKREAVYVGARVCASCHEGPEMGHQYSRWLLSKHSKAYAALALPEAAEMARLSGIPIEPQKSPVCLGCHATGSEAEEWEKDPTFSMEDGVQCEMCHGPGSEYMDEQVMRDPEEAFRRGLKKPTEIFCAKCHYVKGSHVAVHQLPQLDIQEARKTIAHPTPDGARPGTLLTMSREPQTDGARAYTGVQACAACHGGPEMGYQYSRWRLSAHARAYAVLATPGAAEMAAAEGVKGDPQKAPDCLRCHVTGQSDPPGAFLGTFYPDEGVGCEACHGAGSRYVAEAIMRDPRAAAQAGLEPVSRETCRPCHKGAHGRSFDYEAASEMILHPSVIPAATTEIRYKTPVNLAVSPDGAEIYVACESSDSVVVVDVAVATTVAEIQVGGQPHDVAFSPDGKRVYVSNRLGDSVSVIDVARREVVKTFPVGDEPHGLVTDVSGERLFVANTAEDSISVADTATLAEIKRLSGSRNPWSLSLSPDGSRLLVTNNLARLAEFREPALSEVTVIETEGATVEERLEVAETNLLQGVSWHPGGEFALLTMNRTKNLVPMTRILQGWTITNGIGIVWKDGRVDQVLLDEPNLYFPDAADVAFTPDGALALVTSSGSDRVAVVDVEKLVALLADSTDDERRRIIPNHLGKSTEFVVASVPTQASPRGVVVTPDGSAAFVANALDDSLTRIDLATLASTGRVDLGGPQEITQERYGERLFHSADIAFQRQFSCHSCHPDGHVDGITYDIEPDGIGFGPVDNRTLRGIRDTDPFKWTGKNLTLTRQCGPRLAVFFTRIEPFDPVELSALERYISTIPRPPNRHRPLGAELTPAQRRGKAMFERTHTNDGREIPAKGRCVTCHFPPLYTDRSRQDVGTMMWLDEQGVFDVPHLNNIYSSAPYLHNGIAHTLEEIWTRYNPEDKHGVTNDMTKDQLNDLIEYLKTL